MSGSHEENKKRIWEANDVEAKILLEISGVISKIDLLGVKVDNAIENGVRRLELQEKRIERLERKVSTHQELLYGCEEKKISGLIPDYKILTLKVTLMASGLIFAIKWAANFMGIK